MNSQIKLNDYKQQIANLYNARSSDYDNGDWHPRIARRLVEYAKLNSGQQILDIATGTGMVAIEAAQIVGDEGRVLGIDISAGMLEVAQRKSKKLNLNNIEFCLADAEALNFPDNSFDRIFCSSAFIWMSDLVGALKLWYSFLKPGGLLSFHAFADTAFVGGVVAQTVLERYGVSLQLSQPTGTVEKCDDLLKQAGFEEIDIQTEADGNYISLEKAKRMWLNDGLSPTPGQHPNPLLQLSPKQLAEAKAKFYAELEMLNTERGIWNDATIFYTFGRKAASESTLE